MTENDSLDEDDIDTLAEKIQQAIKRTENFLSTLPEFEPRSNRSQKFRRVRNKRK
jgi:acetyl-CoA carboxylase alpha subunit